MSKMISVASGFQYSVNIGYDLGSNEKLQNFIPTKSALSLLEEILLSTDPASTERARVLIGAYGRTINFAQMTYCKNDLIFNYRLITLLDKEYEPDTGKRLDKAFRYIGTPQAELDEKRFEEYMRGGIDVLYEKLVAPGHDYEKNLILFLEEFDERYLSPQDAEVDLVKIAHEL